MAVAIDFERPSDFMRLAGAPLLIATGLVGSSRAFAETARSAYGPALDLSLGIVAGALGMSAVFLLACLVGSRLQSPRARVWLGRGAWATSRLALALAAGFGALSILPALGLT